MFEIFKNKTPQQQQTNSVAHSQTSSGNMLLQSNDLNVDNSVMNSPVINNTSSSLSPPKNLPDLAKDLFSSDQVIKNVSESSMLLPNENLSSVKTPIKTPEAPSTSSAVPKLDLNLIKSRTANTVDVTNNTLGTFSNPITQPTTKQNTEFANAVRQEMTSQSTASANNTQSQNEKSLFGDDYVLEYQLKQRIEQEMQNYLKTLSARNGQGQDNAPFNMNNANIRNMSASNVSNNFFADFENFILYQNPNEKSRIVIEELLRKNILDQMYYYHAVNKIGGLNSLYNVTDGGLRDKFSELKNLENYWMLSKEKQLITNKMVESIEADILYKSEDVKRSIGGGMNQRNNMNNGINNNGVSNYYGNDSNNISNNISASNNFSNTSGSNSEIKKVSLEIFPVSKKITTDKSIEKDLISPSVFQRVYRPVLNINLNHLITFDSSKYFYLSNGVVLNSLKDLMINLSRMDDSTFYSHVNFQKNDFANWIEGVFNQKLLADAIRFMKTKQELQDYLVTLMD